MAGLDFCSKHNMVAYLEKNDGNTEFHQIMDFLTYSSIHFALTVSLIISTLFVKQFWTSAKSRTVNNISYIDAIVAGKPVTISEASIRSNLLFDDVDGINTLNNQAIFDTIQLMGFLQIFLRNQLRDVPVPMDHFPVPALTKKPDPSPRPSSSIPIPDSNPEGSSGNHGGQLSSDRSLSGNEDGLTLQSVFDLCISFYTLETAKEEGYGENKEEKESLLNEDMDYTIAQDEGKTDSKIEEPKTSSKTEELHLSGDTLFAEDKGSAKKEGSTKSIDLQQSTVKPDESTVKPNEGTDKQDEGTDRQVEGTAENKDQDSRESATPTAPTMTSTPTLTGFGDDKTIAQVLVIMSRNKVKQKEKEKGVELKNVEDI
ncbi:hypothetical protein Tco_0172461 [Tanacetum coccineum]